jgi:DnaK suppressor protein
MRPLRLRASSLATTAGVLGFTSAILLLTFDFAPVDAFPIGAYHIRLASCAMKLLCEDGFLAGAIMEKKKLESFKKRLETRQQELRHMVTRNQKDGRAADDEATQDVADRAASSYTKEFLFSQSNNDRQLLNMVESALARIREGSFGECVSCGKEINAKRLEAVPWTRHCIECQEKAEKGLLEAAQ